MPPPISVAAWTKLPNVGREGHAYLFHIINNYHNLADITFFLQGRIEDHTRGITLDALLTEIRRSGISFFGEYLHPKQGCLDYENFLNFWKKTFKIPIPRNIFYSGACFGVRKELIYNHPIAFYRRLLQVLDKKICPKEGYHIERMWYFIFNPVAAIGY